MEQVTLAEAKEHLDELMQRAARGEDVRIADPQLGTVKLQPVAEAVTDPRPKRVPGRWKDRLPEPPDNFFDPLSEEELKDWYGEAKQDCPLSLHSDVSTLSPASRIFGPRLFADRISGVFTGRGEARASPND